MATTTEINPLPKELDAGMMIRRALFLLVLVLLTLYYLAYDFKGLSHPIGMEQATVGRQIARGEKYMTKSIIPVRLAQINEHLAEEEGEGKTVKFSQVPETYHAPLNPMLNSMILSINPDLWKWEQKGVIYTPDILIAGMAMVLLLSSIGVTYLLVSRIFDTRIAGVTAFLMLLCQLLWRYAQSGLPHRRHAVRGAGGRRRLQGQPGPGRRMEQGAEGSDRRRHCGQDLPKVLPRRRHLQVTDCAGPAGPARFAHASRSLARTLEPHPAQQCNAGGGFGVDGAGPRPARPVPLLLS